MRVADILWAGEPIRYTGLALRSADQYINRALVMGNGKLQSKLYFPLVNRKILSFEKDRAYLRISVQTQNAILGRTPTLNLTQTLTLALTLIVILTQTQNLNPN